MLLKHIDMELDNYATNFKQGQAITTFPILQPTQDNKDTLTYRPFFQSTGTVCPRPGPTEIQHIKGADFINRLIELLLVTLFDYYIV